jgi:hypothetical protein
VGLDTLGNEGCRSFIEAANPQHPSLIDRHHVMAELFGVVNIPSSIWINEDGMIVRPAEAAAAPPKEDDGTPRFELPDEVPQRLIDMMTEAAKIPSNAADYHAALKDWVKNGSSSQFALTASEVVERSGARDEKSALGHAHFELASQLEIDGNHELAVKHFRLAHQLVPDSWTFRRQAWSLEQAGDGPLRRFWQGPNPENPEEWPYEGDWLSDIRANGAENYNSGWNP